VSGQIHAPVTLPPEKKPPVPIGQEVGWAAEPVWMTWRKFLTLPVLELRPLGRPAHCSVHISTFVEATAPSFTCIQTGRLSNWLISIVLVTECRFTGWPENELKSRCIQKQAQSTLTQVLTILACIREVLGSNLGRDIDYPEVSCGCPQSFRTIVGTVPQIRPLLLPSISPANLLCDHNVIFQHPVVLYTCRSNLGVSTLSKFNVVRCSFIGHYFTTCFGLNGHLQVYRLL
jgi:hypothetical protein